MFDGLFCRLREVLYYTMGPNGPKLRSGPVSLECMAKIFMKFGHQIACRDTKHLKNLNDIDTTSNDLDMTFNYVFSTYLILGPSYCPRIIQ